MNRLVRLALLLYPRQWRARYGEELAALLEQTNGGWRDTLNIVKGAIIMQLSKTATLALGAAAGVAICLAAWAMHDTGYEASVTTSTFDLNLLGERTKSAFSRKSLTSVIERYNLYPEERKRMPLEDVIENMRNRNIKVSPVKSEGALFLFHYHDEIKARQVATELSSALGFSTKQLIVSKPPRAYFTAHVLLGIAGGALAAFIFLRFRPA